MSKQRFRTLVRAWVIVFVLRFIPWPAELPAELQTGRDAMNAALRTPLNIGGLIVFLALLVAGLIGMYRFWKLGPYLFLSAPVLAFLASPIASPDWLVLSGWEVMFEGLATLFAGVIFSAAVLGPARELFERGAGSRG